MNGIIGHTGFVGSNLVKQIEFDHKFNSKNIEDISNNEYELLVCSGIPSLKWYANKHPEEDLNNINGLVEILKTVKCKRFVLISTIDVCKEKLDSYGKNRLHAETRFQKIFGDEIMIVRLPSLFGKNLKKNILFDLINHQLYQPINLCDEYQWYDLNDLGDDIKGIPKLMIPTINLFPEPVSMKEIVDTFFELEEGGSFSDCDTAIKYDFKISDAVEYWDDKETVLKKLKKFIDEQG